MSTILEVRDIGKKYRIGAQRERYLSLRESLLNSVKGGFAGNLTDFWALKDISFDVNPGDTVGIVGRNGAGKSTLLKVLSRITPPTVGHIRARGRVASLLEVGTGFHPELSGRENIFLNGSILGLTKREIQSKFDEIVSFSGVEKFLETPLKRYSSGMQLRLAFAVAAHLEPEILVIDEVLAVGDSEFQKKCLGKMDEVSKSGRTILFVSHNMEAVRHLCKKGVLLVNGKTEKIDTIDAVVDEYLKIHSSFEDAQSTIEFDPNPTYGTWVKSVTGMVDGSPSSHMLYGQNLSFDIAFESTEEISEVVVGLVISSIKGEQLINTNNVYQQTLTGKPGEAKEGRITCDLGMVPLMEGSYFVSFWVGNSVEHIQTFKEAFVLQVGQQDIWGKGKLPPMNMSNLWWPTTYTYYPELP